MPVSCYLLALIYNQFLRNGGEANSDVLPRFRRNELSLQAAGEGIYVLDAEGNTIYLNPAVSIP
jgi:hypothetical protein